MAIDADHLYPVTAPRSAPPADMRTRAIRQARRHTKLVQVLRIAFPLCALVIVALYFLSSKITISVGGMQASVARVEISKDRLRMVNPKLEGVTDKKGVYAITADYADQEPSDTSIIHLTAVRAEVNDPAESWTRMTAPKGRFDTKKEALTLTGEIKVASSTGVTSLLSRADIDMKTQVVVSNEPVKVTFPDGKLDSRAMRIRISDRIITFKGDVRVHTLPPAKEGESEKAAAKPKTAEKPLVLAGSRDKPIDIAAPQLTIYDKQQVAHFLGGVTTDQGGSRMTSQDLKLYYDNNSDAAGGADAKSGTSLRRIEASGDIRIVAADGRRASAKRLSYEAATRQLTLDQDVVLVQGDHVLRGPRMIADLVASTTRFPAIGRVHGHFVPDDAAKQRPDGAAPGKPSALSVAGGQLDLSSTRGQPVDVDADSLDVFDKKKVAVFRGDVHTVQGGMTLRSKALHVDYSGGTGTPGKGGAITTIKADGPVLINTDQDQTATSEWALFEASSQTVTIGGNVVLSQGENVIKGDRLVIDLTTGRSRFEHSAGGAAGERARVKGLFLPRQVKRDGQNAPGAQPQQ